MRNERYLRVSKKIKESIVPFAVLFSLFVFLAWLIVKPLGGPLLWSAVLSYFAYPFYKGMYRKLISKILLPLQKTKQFSMRRLLCREDSPAAFLK